MCEYCDIINKKQKATIFYEDEIAICFIKNEKQLVTIPKKHYVIIEQIPDNILTYLLMVTSRISGLMFEAMGATGTNIIIDNGSSAGQKVEHFSINTIFRTEMDDFDFSWNPVQLSQEQLLKVQEQFIEGIKNIFKEPVKEVPEELPEEKEPEKDENKKDEKPKKDKNGYPDREDDAPLLPDDVDDYRIKQLIRIP